MMDTQVFTLILSGLTAVATAFAAYAAIYGPTKAAEHSLDLQAAREERERKFRILATLMAYRKNYGHNEAAQALNIIDLIWSTDHDVKNKWADFFNSLQQESGISFAQRQEKYNALLGAIAKDLGIERQLGTADFGRVYYPTSIANRDLLEDAQVNAGLAMMERARAQVQTPDAG